MKKQRNTFLEEMVGIGYFKSVPLSLLKDVRAKMFYSFYFLSYFIKYLFLKRNWCFSYFSFTRIHCNLNGFLNARKIDKNLFLNNFSIYTRNKLHHGKCFVRLFIHSLSRIRKFTRSLRSLVRFLILLNSWIKIVRAHFPWGNLYRHSTFSLFALFFTLRSTDINRQDNSGKTPLHTAILSNQFSIVNKLVASGADVTITDDAGDSVMHTAIRVGSETLVQVGRPSNRTLDPMLQSWSRKYRA